MASIIIGTAGIKRSLANRAHLIAEALEAWWAYDKAACKDFMEYIHEITKVQHNSGEWRNKKGYLKIQLPSVLMLSLMRAFRKHLPDEPGFLEGEMGDEDIRILYTLAPKLQGSRKRKRHL